MDIETKEIQTRKSKPLTSPLINEEERVISFILVSEDNRGHRFGYEEQLDVNGATVDRLRTFFKDHNRSVDSAIGKVENARIEEGKIKADVRFSSDEASVTVFNKYRDGILSDVSIGYKIEEYKTDERGEIPLITVTRFEIVELSAVGVGFDKGATVGRDKQGEQMDKDNLKEKQTMEIRDEKSEILDTAMGFAASRSDMAMDINELAREVIANNGTNEQFLARLLDLQAKKSQPVKQSATAEDTREEMLSAMTDALALRAGLTLSNQHTDASMFRAMSLKDMVRKIGNLDFTATELDIKRSMVSGDFVKVLSNLQNKTVMSAWEKADTTFEAISTPTSFSDFKDKNEVSLEGGQGDWERLSEKGQSSYEELSEDGLSWNIERYSKKFALTYKMLINDDLGLFTDIVGEYASSAKTFINRCVWELVTGTQMTKKGLFKNYKLPLDGKGLFIAERKNTLADALDVTGLTNAIEKMGTHLDSDGLPLNIQAKTLIVPIQQLVTANQIIASQADPSQNNAGVQNPFQNKFNVINEPLLNTDADAWYLFANKKTMKVGYLNGKNTPTVEEVERNMAHGISYEMFIDFGLLYEDFRSIIRGGK